MRFQFRKIPKFEIRNCELQVQKNFKLKRVSTSKKYVKNRDVFLPANLEMTGRFLTKS